MKLYALFHSLSNVDGGESRTLAEGVTAQVYCGERAMISVVTFEPNCAGKLHAHPEEQWGLLVKGDGIRTQSGKEMPVKAGDFWQTPGGEEHTFCSGPNGAVVFDVFAPPRADYIPKGFEK